MYGNDSGPSRIFGKYKARVVENGEEAVRQIALACAYRNELVRTERRRRHRRDELLRQRHPSVLDAERAEADALESWEAAKAALKKAKGGRPSDEQRAAMREAQASAKQARERLGEAGRARKAARNEAFNDAMTKEALKQIDAEAQAYNRELRARYGPKSTKKPGAYGLAWGSYLFIEASAKRFHQGPPPRYRRRDDVGTIAVQLQGGLSWQDAVGCGDTRFRLEIEPGPAKPMAVAWLRIGSTGPGNRTPTWVKARFRLFRTPPGGSRIKWVYLHRRRLGYGYVWELQLIVERPGDGWADSRPRAESGAAGLDVGWRLLEGGNLRVAYVAGSDGRRESFDIPADWLGLWSKADDLQAIADKALDEARGRLAAWLGEASDAPEHLREASSSLRLWGPFRLAELVVRWRGERFGGDEEIFAAMEAWRRQDRHLRDWRANLVERAIAKRNEHYRRFARLLAIRYRTIRMEDTDWRKVLERKVIEPDSPWSRHYTRISAVGTLLQYVREAVVEWEKLPAANTTRTCHVCGKVEAFDAARELYHTCLGCETRWDQDENASINLLNTRGDEVNTGTGAARVA